LLGAFFPAPGPKPCPPAAGHDDRINGASFHSSFFPGSNSEAKNFTTEGTESTEFKGRNKKLRIKNDDLVKSPNPVFPNGYKRPGLRFSPE
jgi:hypothetical protein